MQFTATSISDSLNKESENGAGGSRRRHTVASFLLKRMIAEKKIQETTFKEAEDAPPAPERPSAEADDPPEPEKPRKESSSRKKAEISCLPVTGNRMSVPKSRLALLPDFDSPDLLTAMTAGFLQEAEKHDAAAVLISSCNTREGKSTVTLNLAKGLVSQTNLRVIVIDANPDNPILHHVLGVAPSPGLSDYLFGRAGYLQIIHHSRLCGYFFTTFGSKRFGRFAPFTGRQRDRFRKLITKLKSQFDYILVDSSSIFGPSDPLIIAPDLDGLLLVVECARTRWEVLTASENKIRKKGVTSLGIALNRRKYYIPDSLYA